jgi:hypothetical protein
MVKIKGILAIGVILLFLGLAFNPATAQVTMKDQLEVSTTSGVTPLQLTDKDLTSMEKFMPALLDKISTAKSYPQLLTIIQSAIQEHGRQPVLVFILKMVIKAIDFNFKFNQLRPVRKTAFILSWGFTNKFIASKKNKINVLRPITGWFYSGRSNVILNSRTIILDPYPFSIKMLTGRQVGLMSNFVGLYIHRSGSIADKAMTFFFGWASTIRGIDLSPMNK